MSETVATADRSVNIELRERREAMAALGELVLKESELRRIWEKHPSVGMHKKRLKVASRAVCQAISNARAVARATTTEDPE